MKIEKSCMNCIYYFPFYTIRNNRLFQQAEFTCDKLSRNSLRVKAMITTPCMYWEQKDIEKSDADLLTRSLNRLEMLSIDVNKIMLVMTELQKNYPKLSK